MEWRLRFFLANDQNSDKNLNTTNVFVQTTPQNNIYIREEFPNAHKQISMHQQFTTFGNTVRTF